MKKERLYRLVEGRNIPVYYRGKRFEKIRDLAQYLGITLNQIKGVLTDKYKGELHEKEVSPLIEEHFKGDMCYIAFKRGFQTFEEMSLFLKLPANVLHGIFYKLKEGQVFEEEVRKRYANSTIIYEGVEYETLAEFCRKKRIDYPLFMGRLMDGMSFEEALTKEVTPKKGYQIEFRGTTFNSVREFFNYYGYSRTMCNSLKSIVGDREASYLLELYLRFLSRYGLPNPEELLTAIPMAFYDGQYYIQSKKFFEQVGITPRNFSHEKQAKENIGLTDEEIVLNMSTRINKHTGERMFPNCTVNSQAKLVFVKNRFCEYAEGLLEIH